MRASDFHQKRMAEASAKRAAPNFLSERRAKKAAQQLRYVNANRAKVNSQRASCAALKKVSQLKPLGLLPLSAVSGTPIIIRLPKPRKVLTEAERAIRRRLKNQRKNAKRRGAKGRIKAGDIEWLQSAQRGRCFYCCKKLGQAWHIDHFHPLSRGGSNERQNLRLACPNCNIAKSDKPASEFLGLLVV